LRLFSRRVKERKILKYFIIGGFWAIVSYLSAVITGLGSRIKWTTPITKEQIITNLILISLIFVLITITGYWYTKTPRV